MSDTVAVVISALSAGISAFSAITAVCIGKENTAHNKTLLKQSDTHNRMTVRPLLVKVRRTDVDDKGVTYIFGVENAGVGPAVIRHLNFYFQKEIMGDNGDSGLPEALAIKCLSGLNRKYQIKEHGTLGVGSALLAGREKIFIELFFPSVAGGAMIETRSAVEKALEQADYEVNFTSIYGDEDFPLITTA